LLDTKGGTVKPHNMRWFASMVSDLKRLLMQGGMFAYPGANRKGYEKGHLRLVYEANGWQSVFARKARQRAA